MERPDGLVKIGFSAAPDERAKLLRSQHKGATIIKTFEGGRAVEAKIHRQFDSDRVEGEWFRPSAALLAFEPTPIDRTAGPHSCQGYVRKIRNALSLGLPAMLIARRAGISTRTMSGVESENWNPRLNTMISLADAVDQIATELYHG